MRVVAQAEIDGSVDDLIATDMDQDGKMDIVISHHAKVRPPVSGPYIARIRLHIVPAPAGAVRRTLFVPCLLWQICYKVSV